MPDAPLHELIPEPEFRRAVELLDAGDVAGLEDHLATHPELLSARSEIPGEPVGAYFARPYLLWFVAENPIRNRRLPDNIVAVTRTIIAAARTWGVLDLQQQLDRTLALVVSGCVARETGQQRPLIQALVAEGASPDCLETALAHRELDAVEGLFEAGAALTLPAAAGLGRLPELRRMLAADPPPGSEVLQQALALAGVLGQPEAAELLCCAGADPNAYNPPGFHAHSTPLHQAVCYGHLATVQALLRRGADPTLKDTLFGSTALGWAEHCDQPEVAAYLRDHLDFARCIVAIEHGDLETLRDVCAAHPEILRDRLADRTLLHYVCDWPGGRPNQTAMVELLVAAGADPDAGFTGAPQHGCAPLHWAASNPDAGPLIEALLAAGASLDRTVSETDNSTPLTNAVRFGQVEAAQALLARDATLSLPLAAAMGDAAFVRAAFGPYGLRPELRGLPGCPANSEDPQAILDEALIWAARQGQGELAMLLLEHGASPNARSRYLEHGGTALHWSALHNHTPVVGMLLAAGADPTLRDATFDATAEGWARHAGYEELAGRLAERGHGAASS